MSLGIWELSLIVVLVLLVFGAGKLPSVMGDLAKGVKSFKKGLTEEDINVSEDKKKSGKGKK